MPHFTPRVCDGIGLEDSLVIRSFKSSPTESNVHVRLRSAGSTWEAVYTGSIPGACHAERSLEALLCLRHSVGKRQPGSDRLEGYGREASQQQRSPNTRLDLVSCVHFLGDGVYGGKETREGKQNNTKDQQLDTPFCYFCPSLRHAFFPTLIHLLSIDLLLCAKSHIRKGVREQQYRHVGSL